MSDKVVIKAENISKMYRLGAIGMTSMVEDVHRTWAKWRGKEDPYQKIAVQNDRSQKQLFDYVWSLKNIDFEIHQGDAVGIIGKNGAGKSTLLKLLSRVTTPTSGSIKMKGRIASLLEVGTGFHPELTGRENVFMNGTIMGLSRKEIASKLDEIVDFAGVEQYLDTPVKRYSSGMYVRLGFSVAAHLEPDILIVDEVLAVGDAEFQKKCLGKMKDVNSSEGRTVLFVSHNMASVYSLTTKAMLMQQGKLVLLDSTPRVIEEYQKHANSDLTSSYLIENSNKNLPIQFLEIHADTVEDAFLKVNMKYRVNRPIGSVVALKITNMFGIVITTIRDTDLDENCFNKVEGTYHSSLTIDISTFIEGIYRITFSTSDMKSERYDYLEDCLTFNKSISKQIVGNASREGVVLPIVPWVTNRA